MGRHFQEYGTFIIAPVRLETRIRDVGVPRVWRVILADDPSRRHWCDERGYLALTLYDPPGRKRRPDTRGLQLAKQVIILTRDEITAERVQSVIYGGILLGYPDLSRSPCPDGIYPVKKMPDTLLQKPPFYDEFHVYEAADFGCCVAEIAWKDQTLIYAVEKYRFSLSLDWFTPQSGHPASGQRFPNRYEQYSHHVSAAFSIIAAYAAVEELGLEVRSSQAQPRFIGPNKNWWNPEVRSDLERRLNAFGIDGNESFVWIRRGPSTAVERVMKPKLGKPSRWTKTYRVRDQEITLIDAIHQLSWLRNYVAAHKFRALTSDVSPYDVHNAQMIARRILLGRLGLWKTFSEHRPATNAA